MGHHYPRAYCKFTNDASSSMSLISHKAVFWVETKGKSLEEIDALFDENKHTTINNIEDVRKGRETIDVAKVEYQLQEGIGNKTDTV